MSHPSREALAKAYRDAADALDSFAFDGQSCCGIPLDLVGRCVHRPTHPTVANPNITGYPESYDPDGTFIG